jgi:hypothetical protein
MQALLQGFRLAVNGCGTRTGFLPGLFDGVCPNGHTPELNSLSDILIVVGNVAQLLIALAGALAIIAIIGAAIYYVISGGDAGRIRQAKDILINAIVGLVVILAAYATVNFIARGFN